MKNIISLTLVLIPFSIIAQRDNTSNQAKYSSSMYDPSSIFYNKDKFILSLGVGYFGYIDNEVYNNYGAANSIISYDSPVFNISFDYGQTEKHTIGIGMSYQSVTYFHESNISSEIGNFKIGNIGFRYTHSMGSWELLYYGIRLGVSFGKASVNEKIFPDMSSYSSIFGPTAQLLLGARLTFSKHVIIHIEAGALAPYTIEGGLTFRIDMHKKGSVQGHD